MPDREPHPPPDAERHRRIKAVLHAAAALEGPARASYLEDACAGDAALRADVERLLQSDGSDTGALGPGVCGAPGEEGPLTPGADLGPYRVERLIGSGGMGTVYAAHARAQGRPVAIKVIHPHLLLRPGVAERFRREVELGSRVEHPNVVRTLAAVTAVVEGRTLHGLVMEVVRGRTLRSVLDALGTVPESLLREIALQAAEGLGAIHAAGIVHRDVKPDNLLLTDDARLRITDLGVAKLTESAATLTGEGHFIGTLAYASPEQCRGEAVGPTADLYALGVVLYELATGGNPFAAQGAWASLRAHVELIPPPAREVRSELSPFVSAVIATLLAKDPRERFVSAQALRAVLADGESGSWWTEGIGRARAEQRPRVPVRLDTPLHGRARDVAELEAAWREARDGRGRVVLLMGEAGLGKSRLAHELVEAHAAEDIEILYGAYRADRHGGALRDALAGPLGGPDARERLESHLSDTPALVAPFAAYLRRDTPVPGSTVLHCSARDALILRVFQGLARRRPVLWIVEDLHHAPAEALRVLTSLAQAAARCRALLLVTSREPLPASVAEAWYRMPHLIRRDLSRLEDDDVQALVADALRDEEAGARLAPMVATLADGIPLFAFEILQGLEASGALDRASDGRFVERTRVERIAVPASLREAVLARLRELGQEESEVLDVAAVQGHAFEPDLIARVRGEPRIRVLEALGRLERRFGLVRSEGAVVRFDHPVVHEVVYEALPPALRAEIHRLLADALWERDGGGTPDAVRGAAAYRIVHHRLRGSEPTLAAPLLPAALRHLEATNEPEAIVDVAERALDVAGLEAREREQLLRRHAGHLQRLGRLARAEAAYREAVALADETTDPTARARARIALAFHEIVCARYEAALATLDEADADLRAAGDAALEAEALGGRGQAWWCLGRYDRARACHEDALRVARAAGLQRFEARASSDLGVVCHELGHLAQAETLLRRALALQEQLGDLRNRGVTRSNLANVFFDQGRRAEALELYEASLAYERMTANRSGEAVALVNLGAVLLSLGALAEAEGAWQRCVALTREIGARRVEAYAHHGLGQLAANRGDTAGACTSFERALRIRREIGNAQGISDSLLALGTVESAAGDVAAAAAHLKESVLIAEAADDENTALMATIHLAALGHGDASDAAGCGRPIPVDVGLPARLADTGLYADFERRMLAEGVLAYEPQYPLWTDGATKRRWIRLPPGTAIDGRDVDAWVFPVGTKLWKEFSLGRRIETRTMERRPDGSWRFATYLWTEDGDDAVLAPARGLIGAARTPGGHAYDVPSLTDCRTCHANEMQGVLGFSALQLSPDRDPLAPHAQPRPPGAIDVTDLLARGLLVNLPDPFREHPARVIASTPRERAVLGYLHANCATCHAPGRAADGLDLDLQVRLARPGNAPSPVHRSTLDVASRFRLPSATSNVRVAAGDPARSVLLQRLASRTPSIQMPPLGTHVVDEDARALIEAWIREDLPGRASVRPNNAPRGQEKEP